MAHSNIIPLFNGCSRPAVPPARPREDVREVLFGAMEMGTGDSVVFADEGMRVLRVSEQAAEVHNLRPADLVGKDVRCLFTPEAGAAVAAAFRSLNGGDSWAGEIESRRMPDEVFPADVTIKRVALDEAPFFCLVIRDLSETRRLRELLGQQRSQRREMYVTVRNLMKAFEKEKAGLERGIYSRIKTLFLPCLEKIGGEPSAAVRASYLNYLRSRLQDLTRGVAGEPDAIFLSLTRSEIQLCRLVRKGLGTKEVADRMRISFETAQTHRRNIRRKLGLNGRKLSLHAYLAEKPAFGAEDAVGQG